MTSHAGTLLSAIAAIILIGCAAQPQVRYFELQPDKAGMLKFTLPKSYIHLDLVQSKERGTFIDAKSVPSDDYPDANKYSLMMQAVQSPFQATNITQFATVPNTRIPAAVGSEVVDYRKEMIETLAKAASLVTIFEAPPQPQFNETVIESKDAENQELPLNKSWKYSLKIAAIPRDALPFEAFKEMTFGSDLKVFPYSACRSASLTLIPPKGDKLAFNLKIADPSYVSLIEIPSKGQITMHVSCGVDVKSEKSSGASVDWGLLGNLIQKVKDTKETIDKKDKGKKP